MAKVQLVGSALVITSAIKRETLKLLKQHYPEALTLKSKEDEPIYKIDLGYTPSITNYGIVFTTENEEGYAQTTMLLNPALKDRKDYVKKQYGHSILKLQQLELSLAAQAQILEKEYAEIDDIIEEL